MKSFSSSFRCAKRTRRSDDAELIAWARALVADPTAPVTDHEREIVASLLIQLEVSQ